VSVNAPAVTEVGLLARRVLRGPRRGRIAAVFERSLYAVFGGEWTCIGQREIGSGPLHVLCEGIAPHRFSLGQGIAVVDATMVAGDVTITGLDAAPVWTPAPPPAWTQESLRAGLAAVDDLWRTAPAEEGLAAAGCTQMPAAPSHVLAAAAPGLAALQRLIEASLGGNSRNLRDDLEIAGLIGLGPGLTPSGDDLLGGALVALASLGRDCTRDVLWSACRAHLERTGEISAAHLRSAARGYAASALHDATHAAMSGRADLVAPAIVALSGIGHSSGRDAFAGALIVLRAMARLAPRGETPRRYAPDFYDAQRRQAVASA
jgi:hypothetical protein